MITTNNTHIEVLQQVVTRYTGLIADIAVC